MGSFFESEGRLKRRVMRVKKTLSGKKINLALEWKTIRWDHLQGRLHFKDRLYKVMDRCEIY